MGSGSDPLHAATGAESAPDPAAPDQVHDPAKVVRITRMAMELHDELRGAPLDEAGRLRLRAIHDATVRELASTLSPHLAAEFRRLVASATDDAAPSAAELRVAQAQLVGWLEGLLRDMEASIIGEEIEARLRRASEAEPAAPGQ